MGGMLGVKHGSHAGPNYCPHQQWHWGQTHYPHAPNYCPHQQWHWGQTHYTQRGCGKWCLG